MNIQSAFVAGERFAAFIDGSNIRMSLQNINQSLNDEKLINLLRHQMGGSVLLRPYRYETIPPAESEEHRRKIINWHSRLEYLGYTVITKEQREHHDGQRSKGNMDGEIITDMMDLREQIDHHVLFSGDGDFCYTVAKLQQRGKRVTVIAVDQTSSKELRRQADAFIPIEELGAKILDPREWERPPVQARA